MRKDSLLTLHDANSLEEQLSDFNLEDEKGLQEDFQSQMILEVKKVEYFFAENLKYFKVRIEKIKVYFCNRFRTN
jgi:hypothetical protein